MIGQILASTGMFVPFFLKSPAPTPIQTKILSFVCLLTFSGWTFWGRRGYCSAVPVDLEPDSNRSPSPAPPSCVYHLSLCNISLLSPSRCRQSLAPQQIDPHQSVLDSPDAFSSWYVSLRTCPIVFVCQSGMLPSLVPCCLPSHFFFSALPVPRTLFLGGVGLKKSSFWGSQLPSLRTPRYPPILSIMYIPTLPCLDHCFLPRASFPP
jgi:hypothetical protein